ncbi:LuxR C-terminal-related transcriptional regulator [Klebsiella pneumoniae]|nr:LuxR C-terminal-related transcriptional regulator [Klebsiella pneumoniae]
MLGLIYSGYSNEQITGELDVAATTIKTHIRNLYQKLGVAHRQDAAGQHAQQLLKMIGIRRLTTPLPFSTAPAEGCYQ